MTDLIIQFSSSTAFMSRMIRTLCHSRFSHMDIVLPGEGLMGVSGKDDSIADLGGVRIRPFEPWPYEIKRTITIKTDKADAIIRAGRSQIGKPFDDEALHAFLSIHPLFTRSWDALDRWFCSEWGIWSCREGGLFPWKLCVPMNKIDPNDGMQLLNPFMSDADVDQLLA